MSNDGWKIIAEAMRRRQEEEAWKVLDRVKKDEIADKQLKEMGKAAREGSDPAFPARTNYHRKRARKS